MDTCTMDVGYWQRRIMLADSIVHVTPAQQIEDSAATIRGRDHDVRVMRGTIGEPHADGVVILHLAAQRLVTIFDGLRERHRRTSQRHLRR